MPYDLEGERKSLTYFQCGLPGVVVVVAPEGIKGHTYLDFQCFEHLHFSASL